VGLRLSELAEAGTLGGLVRYLARHAIQLGVRVREGLGKGQLVWGRPNRATLQNLLKQPLYAGEYVYGRRQLDHRRARPAPPERPVGHGALGLACAVTRPLPGLPLLGGV